MYFIRVLHCFTGYSIPHWTLRMFGTLEEHNEGLYHTRLKSNEATLDRVIICKTHCNGKTNVTIVFGRKKATLGCFQSVSIGKKLIV